MGKRVLTVFSLPFLVFLWNAPSYADHCDDDPANLLSPHNCGFDTDVAGWSVITGSALVWEGGDGDPNLGSMEIGDTIPAGGNYQGGAQSPCFGVTGFTNYNWGARFKTVLGGSVSCQIRAHFYSNGSCSGSGSPGPAQSGPSNPVSWTLVSGSVTPSVSVQSMVVRPICSLSGSPLRVLVDNVYLGVGLSVPVELQSFSVD